MTYRLDEQVGFLLRQVAQRHTALFAAVMGAELTPTQWAALAKLHEAGPQSQNLLGRRTAMDAATIKGVVDRLVRRGLAATQADSEDGRRLLVALTAEGTAVVEQLTDSATRVTEETLAPLDQQQRTSLLGLLRLIR